jgi:hypothetical protein
MRCVPTLGDAEFLGAIFVVVGNLELRPIKVQNRVLRADTSQRLACVPRSNCIRYTTCCCAHE